MTGLPEWVNWIATDESGAVYIRECEPELVNGYWYDFGKVKFLTIDPNVKDWRQSLRRVTRIRHGSITK